ncbi:unnamed protein product [Nezara viridula]|uniref:Uncharacterized protein n=1 Tax=Nezara viridula TaxID=85310 RepID=A0A9P0E3V2_NEZVI|nr:unnamed protein product [Nezara viridula]
MDQDPDSFRCVEFIERHGRQEEAVIKEWAGPVESGSDGRSAGTWLSCGMYTGIDRREGHAPPRHTPEAAT